MVENTKMIDFRVIQGTISDTKQTMGRMLPLEMTKDSPFEVNRCNFIKDLGAQVRRSFHSHRILHQVLVCLSESVKVPIETPHQQEVVTLEHCAQGLYIGPMVWRKMFGFSDDAVFVCFCQQHYDESDYIRDHDVYLREAKQYF